MTRTRYIRQSAAIAIALSIHAAAVAGVLYDCSLPEPATHQGSGGVTMIVAATAAGAVAGSGAASGTADSGKPVPERPLEPTPEQTVPPHAPEIQPDPEPALPTARIPPDAPTTSPSPEVEIERHAWLKQVVPAPLKKAADPPAARPVPQPKRKPDPPRKTAQKPLPATQAKVKVKSNVPAQPRIQTEAETTPQALSTRPESDSTSSAAIDGDQGNSRRTQVAASGGGEISAHGDYLAAVRNWLHEHKRYPRRARLRMLQGDATIGFVLDRAGRVVSYKLQKSSGHEVLDNEVLAMICRASPMPPFPPGLTREKMNFSVPVRFDMR